MVWVWDTILTEKNPKPEACPRGPLRALTAYQLFDLFDFFQVGPLKPNSPTGRRTWKKAPGKPFRKGN